MEQMDEILQQGIITLTAARKHAASDGTDGIADGQIKTLEGQLGEAGLKNNEQQAAVQKAAGLTQQQNEKMADSTAAIKRIREAAKGEYGEENKALMKEFHVGDAVTHSVKKLTTELTYLQGVAQTHNVDLAKHGIRDVEIQGLGALASSLSGIDAEEEIAKKQQKAKTSERDAAMKALRRTIARVRHSAKSIFADDPTVLAEFELIGRAKGAKQPPPTPPPTQTK